MQRVCGGLEPVFRAFDVGGCHFAPQSYAFQNWTVNQVGLRFDRLTPDCVTFGSMIGPKVTDQLVHLAEFRYVHAVDRHVGPGKLVQCGFGNLCNIAAQVVPDHAGWPCQRYRASIGAGKIGPGPGARAAAAIKHRKHRCGISDITRQRAHSVEGGGKRQHAIYRYPAEACFEADEAIPGGWNPH